MSLESNIQSNILEYLNGLPSCIAENVLGCAAQFGRPDINGCWHGRTIRIEVKSPDHGNKPTTAQKLSLKSWAKRGALCFTAFSLDDVKAVINPERVYYPAKFNGKMYSKM